MRGVNLLRNYILVQLDDFETILLQLPEGGEQFDMLIDRQFVLYSCDDGSCHFRLNSTVYEASKYSIDDWRSQLNAIQPITTTIGMKIAWQQRALVKVYYINGITFAGYELVDVVTRRCQLRIGTHFDRNFYPRFTFEYLTPMTPFKSRHVLL